METTTTTTPATVLSAAQLLYPRLKAWLDGYGVSGIYPVGVSREVKQPYVTFYRASLDTAAVKQGFPANCAEVVVQVFSSDYGEGLRIAERVYNALEGYTVETPALRLRSCRCTDAAEGTDGADLYVQNLKFRIRI